MPLPWHGLAAPVEEAAIGIGRKLVEDGQNMTGGIGRRMNLQPSGLKGRRKPGCRRAGMQGGTNGLRSPARQFYSGGPDELVQRRL